MCTRTHAERKEDGERTHGEPHVTPRGDCNPCPSSVAGELAAQLPYKPFSCFLPWERSDVLGASSLSAASPAGVRAWPDRQRGLDLFQAHP